MNLKTTLFVLFIAPALTVYANDCQLAYQQASYSLEHAEKAMASNNIQHLKQYGKRSADALQKAYSYAGDCGCKKASEAAYDGLASLEKAQGYDSFEKSRFYTKESLKRTREMLIALDVCSEGGPVYALEDSEDNLALQQQLLLEQQQRLKEKQRQLEEQMRMQEELKEQLRKEREAKLSSQLELKAEAEAQLLDLELLINNFVESMGCDAGRPIQLNSYVRKQEQLEAESLLATKRFYSRKAQELINAFQIRLGNCALE